MVEKIIFLCLAWGGGALFSYIGFPAGWLLGSIIVGLIYGISIRTLNFSGQPFQLALGIIGVNIGLSVDQSLLLTLPIYIIPLILSIALTLAAGLWFGYLMYKWTDLDQKTAFFCCVPGGASEMISTSREYGADDRIVAALHIARITMFVLILPLVASFFYSTGIDFVTYTNSSEWYQIIPVTLLIIGTAMLVQRYMKLPVGILLYSLIIAFFIGEWGVPGLLSPNWMIGAGQVLIGAMVGVRFDRETLKQLKKIGGSSIKILQLYLVLSFVLGGMIFLLTPLPFMTSILGTVPAGAAEMASTAFALNLDASLVISLQIIRLIVLLLLIPLLIKIFNKIAPVNKK